jgi:DNA-binding transcriptional regulator YhcF (GntR family)
MQSSGAPDREQVDRFIVEEIDSVPQLEALLLFWNNRPKVWSSESMAKALYVSPEIARETLRNLAQRRLIIETDDAREHFVLNAETQEMQDLLASVDAIYRRELVRISNMIHSKTSRGVRDFANAFRLKKE